MSVAVPVTPAPPALTCSKCGRIGEMIVDVPLRTFRCPTCSTIGALLVEARDDAAVEPYSFDTEASAAEIAENPIGEAGTSPAQTSPEVVAPLPAPSGPDLPPLLSVAEFTEKLTVLEPRLRAMSFSAAKDATATLLSRAPDFGNWKSPAWKAAKAAVGEALRSAFPSEKKAEFDRNAAAEKVVVDDDAGERAAIQAADDITPTRIAPVLGANRPTLDPAALYGLAGEIVREVDPHTEADPAAVLFHTLAMFGNAVGRSPYVRAPGGSHHHANIFALIVGDTATGKKGTAAEYPRQIIDQAAEGWKCKGPGLSTGEGLIAGVADLTRDEIQDEVEPRDSRAFWLETEFGRTLRASKREANTLFPVIQQLWDGGHAEVGTRKAPLTATDVHVTIVGHVAPDVLRERLEALNAAEGFANRFLFCWSHESKSLPDDEGLDQKTMNRLVSKTAAALEAGHVCGEFRKDDSARALWRTAYEGLRRRHPGLLGELTHRAAPNVLRIALIYALMDRSPEAIRLEHIEAALAVWKYSVDSVHIIFGTRTGNLIADRIHAECEAVYPHPLTDAEVYDVFHKHVTALQLEIAAQLLGNARLVERTIGKGLGRGGGRSPGLWRALAP